MRADKEARGEEEAEACKHHRCLMGFCQEAFFLLGQGGGACDTCAAREMVAHGGSRRLRGMTRAVACICCATTCSLAACKTKPTSRDENGVTPYSQLKLSIILAASSRSSIRDAVPRKVARDLARVGKFSLLSSTGGKQGVSFFFFFYLTNGAGHKRMNASI